MGFVKGLDAINKNIAAAEKRSQGGSSDSPRTVWLSVNPGQTVKIRFLQELDANSPNYSQRNDLAVLAVEHSNPNNYRRKALCTNDDGGYVPGVCWACDEHRKDMKVGWGQKYRFYANVLVDDGENDKYVAIISQGMGDRSITPTILAFASDEDNPTITDKWFKLTRKGEKKETSWLVIPGAPAKEDVESYDLHDLNRVTRSVPYAEQEAHYLDGDPEVQAAAEPTPEKESTTQHQDW